MDKSRNARRVAGIEKTLIRVMILSMTCCGVGVVRNGIRSDPDIWELFWVYGDCVSGVLGPETPDSTLVGSFLVGSVLSCTEKGFGGGTIAGYFLGSIVAALRLLVARNNYV